MLVKNATTGARGYIITMRFFGVNETLQISNQKNQVNQSAGLRFIVILQNFIQND